MQDKMSIARVPSTIFFGAFSGLLFDFLSEIKLGKRKARKGTLQPHTQIPIAIPHPSIDASRSSRDSPDAAWRAPGRGNRHLHPRERARPERATAATSTTGARTPSRWSARHHDAGHQHRIGATSDMSTVGFH